MLSFVSSHLIICVPDVADEQPSPPLEVDMRTFSQLACAHPLAREQHGNGWKGELPGQWARRCAPASTDCRANAPVAKASSHITALCRADDNTDEDDTTVPYVATREDDDDADNARGATVAPSSMPSQTQPTAVLAEEDTEEDLKDECTWYGHSEWFEAATCKSNEAKKKGARRSRIQRIKKRCEDEARRRGSTRTAQIAIRRAAAAAPPCGSPPVGANTGTLSTTDLLGGITEQLASVNLSSNTDSGRHSTWKCRLDGLLELRQIGLLCVAGRSEHVQRLVVDPLLPSASQVSAADVTVILKVHASAARVSELVMRADRQPAEFDRKWWQQRERENRESSAGLYFDSSHQGATKEQVEARPVDEAAARTARAAAVKERREQEAEAARAPFVKRKAQLQQLLLDAGVDRFSVVAVPERCRKFRFVSYTHS